MIATLIRRTAVAALILATCLFSRAHAKPTATLFATGFHELQGSAVGPGGALYVTAPLTGSIWRVDPKTAAATLFATGLPARDPDPFLLGSGVVDVAFIGTTAYALVTGVAEDLGGHNVVGVYRVDGKNSSTIIADIGAFSVAHPPHTEIFIPTGYQYAIESFRGELVVTDGHHNRVLEVARNGAISELFAFGNVVPTGLAQRGNTLFIAQAGPIPHHPQDGKVVSLDLKSETAAQVASGAPLIVDVEFGPGNTLYALSQGNWDGPWEGYPALENTGALLRVNDNGTFTVLVTGLNRPTSLEIIANTAYVVTLTGEIWKIDDFVTAPKGK